jgi:hypothetical protein
MKTTQTMKKFFLAIFFSINVFLFLSSFSAKKIILPTKLKQTDVLNAVTAALKTGNAKEIIKNCRAQIELGVAEKKQNLASVDAEAQLKSFFAKYPPQNFEFVHQGTSQDGLFYVIGRYFYKGGEFQVYILLKKSNGQSQIDTLDFSKE